MFREFLHVWLMFVAQMDRYWSDGLMERPWKDVAVLDQSRLEVERDPHPACPKWPGTTTSTVDPCDCRWLSQPLPGAQRCRCDPPAPPSLQSHKFCWLKFFETSSSLSFPSLHKPRTCARAPLLTVRVETEAVRAIHGSHPQILNDDYPIDGFQTEPALPRSRDRP